MPKKFYRVNIEVSSICNLQCSFCPPIVRSKSLMGVSLFRRILEEVAPLTNIVALHLMGDPLVHPKLPELIDICEEHGVRIFFVTNGMLLREREAETLLHPAIRQVNFSLHSFSDNFGDKDPSAYLDRIFRYTERAFAERPRLFINYRLWNFTDPRGKIANNEELLRRIEERFGVSISRDWDVRLRKNHILKHRLSLHLDTEFAWPDLALPILGTTGTCGGLASHFGILVDGTVVPCCLDKEAAIELGKIPDRPLLEILRDTRAQAILRGFRVNQLVEDLCQRCQYIERFDRGALSHQGRAESFFSVS